MSTGVPGTGSETGVTGGASGGQTGLTQAEVAAIGAAVNTAVSQATSQMQASINSLSEDIKKVSDSVAKSTTSDVDSETVVRSSVDPSDSQRRSESHRSRIEAYAEECLADSVNFRKSVDAIIIRKLSQDTDHHAALPPMAPRSATGPGTSAA